MLASNQNETILFNSYKLLKTKSQLIFVYFLILLYIHNK